MDDIEKIIAREARATLRALRQGKKLKPIRVRGLVPMDDWQIITTDSTNWPVMYDIPGARSLLPPVKTPLLPTVPTCGHRQPLKLLTDNLAVCWQCGEQFEVRPFA